MALTSIHHGDAELSVHYRCGVVEVIVVRISARASVVDSTLWGGSSWHFVVEGQVVFQQGDTTWEVLPEESLSLPAGVPYTIVNSSRERVKLLTVITDTGIPIERKEPL